MTLSSENDLNDFESVLHSNQTFVLNLTHNEVLYLDDCLTLMIEREYQSPLESGISMTTMRNILPTAPLAVPIELVEKIGIGVLYVTDDDNAGKNVHNIIG